jgi:hypothetical protein
VSTDVEAGISLIIQLINTQPHYTLLGCLYTYASPRPWPSFFRPQYTSLALKALDVTMNASCYSKAIRDLIFITSSAGKATRGVVMLHDFRPHVGRTVHGKLRPIRRKVSDHPKQSGHLTVWLPCVQPLYKALKDNTFGMDEDVRSRWYSGSCSNPTSSLRRVASASVSKECLSRRLWKPLAVSAPSPRTIPERFNLNNSYVSTV